MRTALIRILLPVLAATLCMGDDVALKPAGGVSGTDSRAFMIGWKFTVLSPVTVTGLAYLDATGNGLGESHNIGIFDAASGTVLVSATVPAGTAATYLDGFRVTPVSYALTPGDYVIGGQKLTNADYSIQRSTASSGISQIKYIEERETLTSSFTMPATNFSPNEAGSFGPNFTVASATAATPSITGVTNSASFQSTFAPNTYISLFGTNLSSTTRTWNASDFANGKNLPTMLDGVSATVNGAPAYVEYISPAQINLITPNTTPAGYGVPVVINVPGQTAVTSWINVQPLAPAFFTWPTGTADSGKYLVAQHADYSNVGKTGLFPNMPANFTTPAKPGETIILYGSGFGPTSPAIAPGIITDAVYPLNPLPSATIGGLPAQVQFAGLIPPLSQVYQVNIVVPAAAPNGDLPLIVTVNGTVSSTGLVTVAH